MISVCCKLSPFSTIDLDSIVFWVCRGVWYFLISWAFVVLGVYCSLLLNLSHYFSKLLLLTSAPISLVVSLMTCFSTDLMLASTVFSVSYTFPVLYAFLVSTWVSMREFGLAFLIVTLGVVLSLALNKCNGIVSSLWLPSSWNFLKSSWLKLSFAHSNACLNDWADCQRS